MLKRFLLSGRVPLLFSLAFLLLMGVSVYTNLMEYSFSKIAENLVDVESLRSTLKRVALLNFVFSALLFTMACGTVSFFILYRQQLARISESDRRVKALLDSLPLACAFRDERGEFIECNQELLRLLEVPLQTNLLGHFDNFNPPCQDDGLSSRDKIQSLIREVIRNGNLCFHWVYNTASGASLPVEITMVRVPWENGYRIVSYTTDLRESMINEQKMKEADERNRQLEIESKVAQVASKSKSDFLATMSHEIRTPLNAVIGLAEVELMNRLPESTRDHLVQIHNAGALLLGIVNDILDISKIEAGNFTIIPLKYDLAVLINDVVQLNVTRIASKNINFILNVDETIPAVLYGDELRVKQILNNLLSNAFKYTDEGTVELGVSWEKNGDQVWLDFSVSDTGHGIKAEDQQKLFTAYSQLDAKTNRRIEGTGLGLAITKKLTELMGGSISLRSEYQKGSTFTARLLQDRVPVCGMIGRHTVEALQKFQFMEPLNSLSRKLNRSYMPYGSVLIVDDVPTNLDVAKGLLLPYGLKVEYAHSGREAINRIEEGGTEYDLIFMDHMMPVMDGVEAVRIIREEIGTEYARQVPIVALTANALAGNKEMLLQRGFTGYISKPIDVLRLDDALNRWVRDKQSEETLLSAQKMQQDKENAEGWIRPERSLLEGPCPGGLDIAAGIRRYTHENLYVQVLRSYAEYTPELLNKLHALSEDTLQDYAMVAHGLKGSSYGIFANAVGKKAEKQELAAKKGQFSDVQSGNRDLIEATQQLLRDLDEMLRTLDERNTTAKERRNAPDEELLTALLAASRHYKLSDMEQLLAELEQYSYDFGDDIVKWLRKQTDSLEYEAVQKKLEQYLGVAVKPMPLPAERGSIAPTG